MSFFNVAATPWLIFSLLCQWFDARCTSALLSISSPDLQRQRHIIGSSKWMRKGLLTQSHTFLLLWVFLQDCHRHLTAGCEDTLEDVTMQLLWPIPVRFSWISCSGDFAIPKNGTGSEASLIRGVFLLGGVYALKVLWRADECFEEGNHGAAVVAGEVGGEFGMACCSHMFKGQPETSGSKGICPRKADSNDAIILSRFTVSDSLYFPRLMCCFCQKSKIALSK